MSVMSKAIASIEHLLCVSMEQDDLCTLSDASKFQFSESIMFRNYLTGLSWEPHEKTKLEKDF